MENARANGCTLSHASRQFAWQLIKGVFQLDRLQMLMCKLIIK